MRLTSLILLLALASPAHAAKLTAFWMNPSTNNNGTPLTNLSYIIVEWGTCNGALFGTMQSSIMVMTTEVGLVMSSPIYPTGLTKVCLRAVAVNMEGAQSDYSNVASKDLLPSPGKPVTLDQPIIISFNKE